MTNDKIKQNFVAMHEYLLVLYDFQKEVKAGREIPLQRTRVEDTDIFESRIMLLLIDDDNTKLERKIALITLHRSGYQYIRAINEKLAFKVELTENEFAFLENLETAEAYFVLDEIYGKDEMKIIDKQFAKYKKGKQKNLLLKPNQP